MCISVCFVVHRSLCLADKLGLNFYLKTNTSRRERKYNSQRLGQNLGNPNKKPSLFFPFCFLSTITTQQLRGTSVRRIDRHRFQGAAHQGAEEPARHGHGPVNHHPHTHPYTHTWVTLDVHKIAPFRFSICYKLLLLSKMKQKNTR